VLPLGEYSVSVEGAGFGSAKRTGILLSAGSTATVDIALQVAGVATTVEISAAAPISEPSRTDIGSTLSTNQIVNLPLISRNPYNFILLQPNVSGRGNQEFGVPRKLNANGFNGRVNYQLDGNANTQSDRAGIRLIPISNTFVAEVQNVSNGFAPSSATPWAWCSTPSRAPAPTICMARAGTFFAAPILWRVPRC
jgi:hypothetical protein